MWERKSVWEETVFCRDGIFVEKHLRRLDHGWEMGCSLDIRTGQDSSGLVQGVFQGTYRGARQVSNTLGLGLHSVTNDLKTSCLNIDGMLRMLFIICWSVST